MKQLTKIICLALFINLGNQVSAQEKNYTANAAGSKISSAKIVGEENTLLLSSTTATADFAKPSALVMGAGPIDFSPLVETGIKNLFKLGTYFIENRIKKYTGEYSAKATNKNTLQKKQALPGLTYSRFILLKDGNASRRKALELKFEPELTGDRLFAFKLTGVEFNYSKAKLYGDYRFIDLTVEIAVVYFDENGDKKTQTSSPMTIPLVNVGGTYTPSGSIYSDNFATDKRIAEVHLKVIETNPYKIKAEKLKALSDKFSSDAENSLQQLAKILQGKKD